MLPILVLGWQNIELQVLNYPEFETLEPDSLNAIFMRTDSLLQINFLTGGLFRNTPSDSTLVFYYNSLNFHYYIPTDYGFKYHPDSLYFQIMAANIKTNILNTVENIVVKADSMKVGIFALYSPDYMVLNEVNSKVKFNYDIFKVAEQQTEILSSCDYIIMFSNLTKFIDEDIVSKLPINAVISFDYREQRDELLNNRKTYFYSVVGKEIGRLKLIYEKGKIKARWQEEAF